MKINFLKRMLSGNLAALLLASSMATLTASAADDYYIKFVDGENPGVETIIEGTSISTEAKMPTGVDFNAPPFKIYKDSAEVPNNTLLGISSGINYKHTIIANPGSADGSGIPSPKVPSQTTYELVPSLIGNSITDGTGVANIQSEKVDDQGNISYELLNFFSKITTKPFALTTNSSFKFTINTVNSDGSFTCSPPTALVGDFTTMDDAVAVALAELPASGGARNFTVTTKWRGQPMEFNMSIVMPSTIKIGPGSNFSVEYVLQGTLRPLLLNVISAQKAVQLVRDSILYTPTSPSATDKYGIPFVKLAEGEELISIRSDFLVLTKLQKYVYNSATPIEIEWSWAPADSRHSGVIVIPSGAGSRTLPVSVTPQPEDVKGELVAKVSYGQADPETVRLPITILGLGTSPSIQEVKNFIGNSAPVIDPTKSIPSTMDVYKGTVDGYTQPNKPHRSEITLHTGASRGKAEQVCIQVATTSGSAEAIKIYLNNDQNAYTPGTWIDTSAGALAVALQANQIGQATVTFRFKVKNAAGQLVDSDQIISQKISVVDSSPKGFAEFLNIEMYSEGIKGSDDYPNGIVNYGFTSSNPNYQGIVLPYAAETVRLTPTIPVDKGVSNIVRYWVDNQEGTPPLNLSAPNVNDRSVTVEIKDPQTIHKVLFEAKAENGDTQLYVLEFSRSMKSTGSALKGLSIKNEKGEELLPSFQPSQTTYEITVPYNTRWAQVSATRSNYWAPVPTFDPALISNPNQSFSGANWMKLGHPNDINFPGLTPNTILKVTSYAEDGQQNAAGNGPAYSTTYTVKITRKNPSLNNSIQSAVFKDKTGKELALDNGAVFAKDEKNYALRIPYSTDVLTLEAMPDDLVAQEVRVTLPDGTIQRLPYGGGEKPLSFKLPTPVAGVTKDEFTLTLEAQSEQGSYTTPPYTFHVFRNPPDRDDALQSLELFDQNKQPITRFSFNPQQLDYELSVPFATEQVIIQPKARSPLATVYVDGTKMEGSVISQTVFLRPGESKTALVKVFPEDVDAQPKVYTLKFFRELAGTDARLKSLVATGGDPMTPAFVPSTAVYRVNLPAGKKSLTFTAVPVSPNATMTLNGEALQSGVASAAYEPLTAQSVVTLVVTAQDGKTKMTYTINVTCQDMLYKSNDATLSALSIDYGALSPKFRTNITDYEVAVKDEASSIIITPTATDPGAKIQVFNDSKELGDYRETFAAALVDGENNFRIKVTASDAKTTKEYNMLVYRKEEEKQGTMKPITVDEVDFEQAGNIIVVDISKYAVVSASVFNTLMTDYPEKTIIFEGNDYSLELRGKDMSKLVPYEQVFDLSLTFKSTYEDEIWDIILENPRNNRVEPVFIQFNHHGALPAPMLFTISLGRQYRNQTGAWNYYNEERDRIDFYGGARTNSRGNFSVVLTHMSTYIYSEYQIAGAENKVGNQNIGSYDGSGSSGADKYNPNTGAKP